VLTIVKDRAEGRIYNIGEMEALSEAEWVKEIGQAARWDGEVVVVPKDHLPDHLRIDANMDQHIVVDTTRIRNELGYNELVPRDEWLRRAVEWERANPPSKIDPKQFDYAAEDAALAKLKQRGK
jgi:nucleoside-diphosphate-sugar epimerase